MWAQVGLARLRPGAALNRMLTEQRTDAKMSKIYSKVHGLARDPYAAKPSGASEDAHGGRAVADVPAGETGGGAQAPARDADTGVLLG